MKIVEINAFSYGSTGKIMLQVAEVARKMGNEAITFSTIPFAIGKLDEKIPIPNHYYYGSYFESFIHFSLAQLCDGNGCFSNWATLRLIKQLKKIQPDIIHLHNLHNFNISLPILFRYLKTYHIKTIWTFHDCWAFTGHCCHFDMIGCDKWIEGCFRCPQGKVAPKSRVSRAEQMWKKKKKWITQVEDMKIVTPSYWLANLVKKSFLGRYETMVIHNGIDLSVFCPRESEFRKKYSLQNRYIVLGVAFGWGERKGLDVFLELCERLDERYQIVLVGTDEYIDKILPKEVISIHRTQNQIELAEIYSASDVFVNPTREDTFPTVNMESLACGTPVVTFDTGGSPESIKESCGYVVGKNNVTDLIDGIKKVCEQKTCLRETCVSHASEFNMQHSFQKYIELFEL